MHLAADVVYPAPHRGRCRVRAFEPLDARDRVVLIVSEAPKNTGQSVTNGIYEVCESFLRPRGLAPSRAVVIEHWPSDARAKGGGETFDLVVFGEGDGEPEWSRLDRESVEALVGRAV